MQLQTTDDLTADVSTFTFNVNAGRIKSSFLHAIPTSHSKVTLSKMQPVLKDMF